MSALIALDWQAVSAHYQQRAAIHQRLVSLYQQGRAAQLANLLLGISDRAGNYSASEHGLGPQALTANPNAVQRLYSLSGSFITLRSAREVPFLIRQTALRYFQIGVGSEASCMLNPQVCWVANTRTIWTHLVIKQADNFAVANEALGLYRDAEATSEMAYQVWMAIHAELAASVTRIAEEGERLAIAARVRPGEVKYLWADAIANGLYELHRN